MLKYLTSVLSIGISNVVIGSSGYSQEKPNVVFILADDMGWGDLTCYGHPYIQTPNLDKMAREGMLFTNFYVNGPTCSPSRVGFMTGQFPGRFCIPKRYCVPNDTGDDSAVDSNMHKGEFLDPKITTLTKLLHNTGYRTGHFGKWHLGLTSDSPSPSAYGIDDVKCFNAVNKKALTNDQILQVKERAYHSKLIIDEGIRFIEENKDNPFYVNVWLTDPHAILDPSEEQMIPYKKFRPKGVSDRGALQVYFSVITEIDNQVGRLMKRLDELGLSEKTIVVFSSDNGPEHIGQPSGESSHSGVGSAGPFRGHKHVIYEGGIRTPFIVRWPGHTPAGKVDNSTIISGIDWLPTICSLTGIKINNKTALDGEDMSKAFLGDPQSRIKPLMWEASVYRSAWVFLNISPQLAIRYDKWKLLMNPDKSRIELYDLISDPGEVDNKADNYPDVVETLSRVLLEWAGSLPCIPVPSGRDQQLVPAPVNYPWPVESNY